MPQASTENMLAAGLGWWAAGISFSQAALPNPALAFKVSFVYVDSSAKDLA